MEINKEIKKETKNIETNLDSNEKYINENILLNIEKTIAIINKLYTKNKTYNEIIEHNLFIKQINNNINNYYNKFNINNHRYNFCFNDNNNKYYIKSNIKFKKKINYILKKLCLTEKEDKQNFSFKLKSKNKTDINFLINSIFILKNLINEKNHNCLRDYILFIIFIKYYNIIPINTYIFIIEFYVNVFIDLIKQKSKYIKFIDDLIEAIIKFPFKIKKNNMNNNDNIFMSIISLFEKYFVNDIEIKIKINKSLIWPKLLSNKMIPNLEYNINNIDDNNKYLNKLFLFLVNIYKYNLSINLLFEHIYKNSIFDLNYYLNSIQFLSCLFKEEDKTKKDFSNFNIKKGFYIPRNNPLILEKIKFKENEFSLIFSFRIINDEKDEIIIFNLFNSVNKNKIFKFIVTKEKTIKIIHGNKEWKTDEIEILNNKDYLVCLSQSYSAYKSTKLLFFINDINNDEKEISSLANKSVMINLNNIKTKKNTIKFNTFEIQSPYPYFDSEMVLELGKSNFNGIIGDFIIINKKLKETDAFNLFNLNGYYSHLAENINDKYNLVNKLDNFYEDNKETLIFFKKLNFTCILKILSNKLNNKFVKDKRELLIENFGILKHKKNDKKINVIDLKYSIDFFYDKNGIEFLLFQLHNIANVIDNKNENLNLFNIYLYQTLNFFYDIMVNIDDDNTGTKKNDSLKFSYFILSLMIILYRKKKQTNIKLDKKIYELLLKYIDFYKLNNYYTHRNVIFSLLLDDSFFNQNKILKEGKILVYLMDVIKNNINNDKDIINKEILYKILNLDFILESKDYHHKLYMKLILSLLLIKDNKKIYGSIIKNIITIKNEVKLYHYLKYIYINYESLKELLQVDQRFYLFIKKYLEKETNYFHCKYCCFILFLIYQLKEILKLDEKESKNLKNNFISIGNAIKEKEFLFKYKVYLIKCKFINCFTINNDMKFKFIKNNRCFLFNGVNKINLNEKSNENENKNLIFHINIDLLKFIITSKIILNFNSMINDLYLIYNMYFENQTNSLPNNDNNKEEKELIYNLFDIFKFFWEEIIKFYKRGKYINPEHIEFLNILLGLEGTETFFRIYLTVDYNSAINTLHQIIALSIKTIKHPFYYNYIEIDENIDKYNKTNNKKIKNEITEKIILEIDKINDNKEISIQNRKYLLIIINEILQNDMQLDNQLEKYFIMFVRGLSDKKIFRYKILYKYKGEYYNLLELSLNILFAILKKNNYNKKYNDLIYQFVILENHKSLFYLIDKEVIKGKVINKINNKKKEIDISNILYCLYFLIYFIEIKNNIEKDEIEKLIKNDNSPLNFIIIIITIIFSNSKEIFKLVNKKSFKNTNSKLKKINLEIYNSIFNFYDTKGKKFFSFEELEKYYNEIKYQSLKSKSISFKEFKIKKNTSQNNNTEKNNNEESFEIKSLNESGGRNNKIIPLIIENYINDDDKIEDNKIDQNNRTNNFIHNSISSFSRKTDLKDNNITKKEENEKEMETIKDSNNNKIEEKKEISETPETPTNEIKDIESESSSDDSSEDEQNLIDKKNKIKEKEENKINEEDNELETIKISELASSKEINQTNVNTSTLINSTSSSTHSKTNSITEEESNNNSVISGINNISKKDNFNLKKLIDDINIPVFYYKQLINYNQLYFTKILANPKANYLWKIFTYSFRELIFNDSNFIKLSKCFKIFSKNYILEMSSKEENKYHLNYPTKIKNFICNDYYRPFLKPDIKFFNRSLIGTSHDYIPNKIIEKIKLENKLSNMKFIKFFPIDEKKNLLLFYCENVSYKGSIFGKMYILDSFLAFINKDYKNIKKNREELMFFLYSKADITKYKNIKKVIILYFNEIKEIIIRRFCLKYIGYEIFLKDGRSYLFNFFKTEEANEFSNYIQSKNKDLIINDPINYFDKKDYKTKFKKGEINNFQYLLLLNKFSTRTYNNNSQYLVFPTIYMNLKKNILRDLSKAVCLNKEDPEELIKYKMNFDLLKCHFNTHYSTSAYVFYYLVRLIPYTYLLIDFQSGKFDVPERIFSNYNNYNAALLTSSENRELIPEFFHNYEFCLNLNYNNIGKLYTGNILINHFNSNKYKTSVEFIINHRKYLDNNVNIVPWINNVFGCNQINDSKEIMNIFPLYSYEQFNDFDKEINEIKKELKDKENLYIEIYDTVRSKLAILDLGITPMQLFKVSHPEKTNLNSNNSMIDLNTFLKTNSKTLSFTNSNSSFNDDSSSKKISDKKSEKNENDNKNILNELFTPIKNFISNIKSHKYQIELNNHSMNLFFIFNNEIIIYNILYNSKKYKNSNEHKIDYPLKLKLNNNLIQIEPLYALFSKNICCELMQGFYCICRNDNKTLKFINYNEKYCFSYLWTCIITSIEPYNNNVTHTNSFSNYKWKLYFGDEEGSLNILDYNFKYIFKNNEIKVIDIKVSKKIKIHKNYINNISYNERLNIVISSSRNGDISINNAFSLETLNFINIGTNYFIYNIKISFYDLLYVNCYNCSNKNYYLKCFTLNGIKVTKLKTEKKIINFFISDNIHIYYEDKTYDKCTIYDFKEKKTFDSYKNNKEKINLWENEITIKEDYYIDEKNEKNENNEIDKKNTKLIHCYYCNKIKKLINIYDNNEMSLENL